MFDIQTVRLPSARSVKAQFQMIVAVVWALTLAIVFVFTVGAKKSEDDVRIAAAADDESLDLSRFALDTHRYLGELERSLDDHVAVEPDKLASAHQGYHAIVAKLASSHSASHSRIDWSFLGTSSRYLLRELDTAVAQREAGAKDAARWTLARAREDIFEQNMLPWFDRMIDEEHSYADSLEQSTADDVSALHRIANVLAVGLAALVAAVLWATQRALMTPIGLLLTGTEAIARGDYQHRLRYRADNEFGILARRFDDMAATIETSQRVLVEKHQGLEQAYRLQGEFLSIMSHELRSPLHAILGYTELVLDDEALPSTAKNNVSSIGQSAKRLLAFIDDILDFSKLRAGRTRFAVEQVLVAQLASELVDEARILAKKRALAVQLDLTPEAQISVMQSDPMKLRQILTNLLSNAVKFTESGSITLHVERRPDEHMLFKVSDTGIGIPETQLERVFEPFKQVRAQAEGGTGLGLAIVSRLCELLGGEVTVQSRIGVGSEFTVRLPINAENLHGQHSDPG